MERITNVKQLHTRIAELELAKDLQEFQLKRDIGDLVHSLSPIELVKNLFKKVTTGGEEGGGSPLANLGFGLLSRTVGSKSRSIGGALKSVAAVEVVKVLYNNNQDKINDFLGSMGNKIGHWFKKKADKMHDKLTSEDD